MKRLRNTLREYIFDSDVDIKDRSFIVLSFAITIALIITMLVGRFLLRESIWTTITTGIGTVLFLLFVSVSFAKKKIRMARTVVSIVLVFVFLPTIFFTGGGIYGGAPVWMILGTVYLVFVHDGFKRLVYILLNFLVIIACWTIGYIFPKSVVIYSNDGNFIDSIAALLTVGFITYVIMDFQARMHKKENDLAHEKMEEVEEMNRSQNRFFSSMSHEIRTPINTVLGLNEIILRQEDASDEIIKDAKNIRGAGKLLLALINDILDVSKIEAGKMDIVPVDYNVGNLVSEIVNMIWMKADEKGLKFNVNIDPAVPEILYGDEVRIKQILINLLNNAVKYTAEGSISLHIECDIVDDDLARLNIMVSDTGMGIKQEALPHLFDTFQRLDEQKNRHIEGTGLGLSIVKQLVDLMNGEISVSSVYTQGSTFAVKLDQKITSSKKIGDLNIKGMSTGRESKFEHSFHAPEARILIVDDNEMNLQVEEKLLAGTEMTIDLARSGRKALSMTMKNRYDVIFMDHLMPEMDGIDCFTRIREQRGGLNKNVPIIVLTANAGSDNIELYNSTGFNGYLVKPVSGDQLEKTLLTFIPEEKIKQTNGIDMNLGSMNTATGYARIRSVAVATCSMVDIPKNVLRSLEVDTIPFCIGTEDGTFYDGVDIDSDEMSRYMEDMDRMVTSIPMEVEDYVQFFSQQIKKTHHLIFITITPGASVEYGRAMEAAKSFDNVTVVDSEFFSSAAGMLVLIAAKMARQNEPVNRILEEIEAAKKRLSCSFVISNTDYMTRRGLIGNRVNEIFKTFWLRPSLVLKKGKIGVGRIMIGSREKCFKKYIKRTLSKGNPDSDLAFITYTGLPEDDLQWIVERVRKQFNFNHIVFQMASAGITSNCGPGTFGILFMKKGDKNYNLSSLFPLEDETDGSIDDLYEDDFYEENSIDSLGFRMQQAEQTESVQEEADEPQADVEEQVEEDDESKEWYEKIPGIDAAAAIKNSGSEEAFLMVIKIYHESHDDNKAEICGYYDNEDWENYTIKVHALKSSSRLVGALQLGDEAEKLEAAGKSDDLDYIRGNHDKAMAEYDRLYEALTAIFDGEGSDDDDEGDTSETASSDKPDKPVAEDFLMESVYEMLREGAEGEDDGLIKDSFAEMDGYTIPDSEKGLYESLKPAYEAEGYAGLLRLLDEAGK